MACENADVLEVIRPNVSGANAKVAIFDFDGTISLIRSGWMEVMVPLCLEQLEALKTGESRAELRSVVEEFVWRLTGKETIYQMMALTEAIQARGGQPHEPIIYKKIYLDRLWVKIRNRVEGLRTETLNPEQFLVPGAKAILKALCDRGLVLYLASGTDYANVKEEARLLGVSKFFAGGIFGALDDLKSFSKALLVQRILSQAGRIQPDELLVFGDGYVEIEEVHKVGGIAVGVATAEPDCRTVDPWKRDRLARAGADLIVPNYLDLDEMCEILFHVPVVVKQ
jgi:phosphoglycolate phosphatase-like HAD superfamily hydrolase